MCVCVRRSPTSITYQRVQLARTKLYIIDMYVHNPCHDDGVGIVNAQIPLAEASTYHRTEGSEAEIDFFLWGGGEAGVFLPLAFCIYFITSQQMFSVFSSPLGPKGASIFFQ